MGIIKKNKFDFWWETNFWSWGLPFYYGRFEELLGNEIEITQMIRIGPICFAISYLMSKKAKVRNHKKVEKMFEKIK